VARQMQLRGAILVFDRAIRTTNGYKLNPASGLFVTRLKKTPITECWRSVKFHSGEGAADEVIFSISWRRQDKMPTSGGSSLR